MWRVDRGSGYRAVHGSTGGWQLKGVKHTDPLASTPPSSTPSSSWMERKTLQTTMPEVTVLWGQGSLTSCCRGSESWRVAPFSLGRTTPKSLGVCRHLPSSPCVFWPQRHTTQPAPWSLLRLSQWGGVLVLALSGFATYEGEKYPLYLL